MMNHVDRSRAMGRGKGGGELRGIVITMGEGRVAKSGPGSPRLQGFVYGEFLPRTPSLPFGRWKKVS